MSAPDASPEYNFQKKGQLLPVNLKGKVMYKIK